MIIILSVIVIPFGSGVSLANAPLMDKPAEITNSEQNTRMWIQQFALEYGASEQVQRELFSVAHCESGFNHKAVGDSGKSLNVFQWQKSFWDDVNKRFGYSLDRNSSYDQVKVTVRVFVEGTESDKRNWTSYRALKNGGVYTFYSRIEKKDITVRCNYLKDY